MSPPNQRQQRRGGLELVEESVHLLRTSPPAALAAYYLGAVPFVLGLLFFWADMSRSPFASQHLAEGALGLAGLFLWMKSCQVVFAAKLRAYIAGEPPERLSVGHC